MQNNVKSINNYRNQIKVKKSNDLIFTSEPTSPPSRFCFQQGNKCILVFEEDKVEENQLSF